MPAKRFRSTRTHWTKEKSAAVMKKFTQSRTRGEPIPMDPAVEAVRDSLEENLFFFMKNVSQMVAQYRDYLKDCIPPQYIHNERKQQVFEEFGDAGTFHAQREANVKEEQAVAAQAAEVSNSAETAESTENKKKKADAAAAATADIKGPPPPDRTRVIKLLIVEEDSDEEDEEGVEEPPEMEDSDDEDSEADETAEAAPEIVFPDNKLLLKHLHTIKREAYALNTTFNGIHDWVAFNIPTDPNEGTAAEIMQAVMTQTLTLSEAITSIYDMESKYLGERLEAETSAVRHPDCYSMQDTMLSLEVETWDDLKRAWWTMQRVTMIEHTVLAKNMKILTKGVSKEHERLFV